MANKHVWRFFRAGGVDQVVIDHGADVEHLSELDLKLWLATAMPTKGTNLDEKTAKYFDHDDDGRIRAPDVIDMIAWLKARIATFDTVLDGKAEVAVASITDEALAKTAARISTEAGGDGKVVKLDDVTDAEKRFDDGPFNGDGIITAKATDDAALKKAVEEIVTCFDGVTDRSGQNGVDKAKVEAFFADVEKLVAWHDEGKSATVEKPLGEGTEKAADLVRGLTAKLDDYYTRCRLAAFDDRASAAAHGAESELAQLASRDVGVDSPEITRLPLARVLAGQPLPFEGPVNPGFAAKLVELRDTVVRPLLGASINALSEADFRKIQQRLHAFEAWRAEKPDTKVDALPAERLRELTAGDLRKQLEDRIAKDDAEKAERARIMDVEKLVYMHRDFGRLLRNFVNFSDFYGKKGAIFQTGTLYLDGRSCSLCVEVADTAKHVTLASLASTYLAYCEIRRKGEPNRTIVAAFTAGDSDNLMVGRNGVFVDRAGTTWDATITRTIENPISIRQAFWSPYKKFVRLVEEQVTRRASEADAQAQARVGAAAEATANADRAVVPPAAPAAAATPAVPGRSRIDVGTVAAIGVAVGGIGAMVTGLVSAFFGLGIFMPLGILALVLLISGPSMLLAYIKLRRRNLGPLLDASGWAINGLAAINVPFGGVLTGVAALPPGADRMLHDPYAEKKSPWKTYVGLAIALFLLVAWTMGKLDDYLPRSVRAAHVLHPHVSAPVQP